MFVRACMLPALALVTSLMGPISATAQAQAGQLARACSLKETAVITVIEDHGAAGDVSADRLGEAGLTMLRARAPPATRAARARRSRSTRAFSISGRSRLCARDTDPRHAHFTGDRHPSNSASPTTAGGGAPASFARERAEEAWAPGHVGAARSCPKPNGARRVVITASCRRA